MVTVATSPTLSTDGIPRNISIPLPLSLPLRAPQSTATGSYQFLSVWRKEWVVSPELAAREDVILEVQNRILSLVPLSNVGNIHSTGI